MSSLTNIKVRETNFGILGFTLAISGYFAVLGFSIGTWGNLIFVYFILVELLGIILGFVGVSDNVNDSSISRRFAVSAIALGFVYMGAMLMGFLSSYLD